MVPAAFQLPGDISKARAGGRGTRGTWVVGGRELKRDNNFLRKEVKLLLKDTPWSIFLVPCQFKKHVRVCECV